MHNSGIPREEIFVITKLYPNQFSDAEVAIDEALAKLDIEYIDLMLLHHPGKNDVKAYKAMEKAVRQGIYGQALSKQDDFRYCEKAWEIIGAGNSAVASAEGRRGNSRFEQSGPYQREHIRI